MASTQAENVVRDRLAYKFGITEEKAYLTGDGSGKPLGLFTASANGVSTGRDVTTSSATAFTGDDLINAKYAVKPAYLARPTAGWCLHRDAVKMARKLKDSNGQYLWQAGLQAGQPDRLLDLPVHMSEYAPNTFTTGLYVGLVGDFSQYTIAEVPTVMIQRLVEKYADTSEIGFLGRMFLDGAPVDENAFARLKTA